MITWRSPDDASSLAVSCEPLSPVTHAEHDGVYLQCQLLVSRRFDRPPYPSVSGQLFVWYWWIGKVSLLSSNYLLISKWKSRNYWNFRSLILRNLIYSWFREEPQNSLHVVLSKIFILWSSWYFESKWHTQCHYHWKTTTRAIDRRCHYQAQCREICEL